MLKQKVNWKAKRREKVNLAHELESDNDLDFSDQAQTEIPLKLRVSIYFSRCQFKN